MILRYFYINNYYEKKENLNINLGGIFRFHYENNRIHVRKNEDYTNSLYEEIPEISDVSAILGKNGAGKTSVLRMINFLFNDLRGSANGKYIVIFELADGKYIIYSKLRIENINEVKKSFGIVRVDRKEMQDRFSDMGLIYYSGIFDKTTPFQENANLKDISINSEFEKFCKERKLSDIEESIVNSFRADNIKREVKFHIEFNKEFEKAGLELLFEVPKKIEMGFIWGLDYIRKWQNDEQVKEQIEILDRIEEKLNNYFEKKENVDGFLQEMLFVLLLDEIVKNIEANKYNYNNALIKLEKKINKEEWNVADYFSIIINELFMTDLEGDIEYKEAQDRQDEGDASPAYEDIWDDLNGLISNFLNLENIDIKKAHKVIESIIEYEGLNENRKYEFGSREHKLIIINDWLSEIEEELAKSDFDLYIVNQLFTIAELLIQLNGGSEEEYKREYAYYTSVWEFSKSVEPILPDGMVETPLIMDGDTINRIEVLKDIKESIISIVEKSEYNLDERKIRISLDDEKVLEFIYKFEQLECKLIELDIDRKDISSGHTAYLDMCTRLNVACSDGIIVNKAYVILLIDEGDIYLHPEMQLRFVNSVLNLVHYIYKNKKVQIIFTSNSPFIISDIQNTNITYLERKDMKSDGFSTKTISSGVGKTFAANVNDLLLQAFFVKNGLIGEFAVNKIDSLIRKLRSGDISDVEKEKYKGIIGIIGEPLIRRKLEKMFFTQNDNVGLKEQLDYYKKQVGIIEKKIEGAGNI